jgi:hypothetical protein
MPSNNKTVFFIGRKPEILGQFKGGVGVLGCRAAMKLLLRRTLVRSYHY